MKMHDFYNRPDGLLQLVVEDAFEYERVGGVSRSCLVSYKIARARITERPCEYEK